MSKQSKINPSNFPQKVNNDCWYYEEKNRIIFVHRIIHNDMYIRTDLIKIPKYKLIKSLKRMTNAK